MNDIQEIVDWAKSLQANSPRRPDDRKKVQVLAAEVERLRAVIEGLNGETRRWSDSWRIERIRAEAAEKSLTYEREDKARAVKSLAEKEAQITRKDEALKAVDALDLMMIAEVLLDAGWKSTAKACQEVCAVVKAASLRSPEPKEEPFKPKVPCPTCAMPGVPHEPGCDFDIKKPTPPSPKADEAKECRDCIGPGVITCPTCRQCPEHCPGHKPQAPAPCDCPHAKYYGTHQPGCQYEPGEAGEGRP